MKTGALRGLEEEPLQKRGRTGTGESPRGPGDRKKRGLQSLLHLEGETPDTGEKNDDILSYAVKNIIRTLLIRKNIDIISK